MVFGPYEVYVDDAGVYASSTKCEGGPWMDPEDSDNFTRRESKLGVEVWCNKIGRYVTIEASLIRYNLAVPPKSISLCSLGIIGTKYEHSIG